MRRNQVFQLEEIPGESFADLAAAQKHALTGSAYDLAANMRRLLASGHLVKDQNKIIPAR